MANLTPSFDRYLKELSYKLGDPVADGVSDGAVFPQESRTNYLNRAYGRLMRNLENIMLDITKVFSDYFITKTIELVTDTDKKLVNQIIDTYTLLGADNPVFDIYDVYCEIVGDDGDSAGFGRIKYCHPDKYFAAKYGDDKYYKPDDDTKTFFYAIIDAKIVFLAVNVEVLNIFFFVKNSAFIYIHGGTQDLVIPHEYEDLYLSMAAEEAMLDEGSPKSLKKAQLYNQLVGQQISIIAGKEQTRRQTEETKTTDA